MKWYRFDEEAGRYVEDESGDVAMREEVERVVEEVIRDKHLLAERGIAMTKAAAHIEWLVSGLTKSQKARMGMEGE